jgi:hypothetical protein
MTQSPFAFAPPRDVRLTHPVRRRTARRVTNLAFALAAVLAAAPLAAQTQQGTVSGTVVVEGAQRPLPGAQISVQGQAGKEAQSDASGRFRITGVTGTTVTLDVRALGFRPINQSVTVGTSNIRIVLAERAVELIR